MNLEGLLYFGTIRLQGKVNFFIRDFFEVFSFPSNFIVAAEILKRDFS